MRTDAPARSAAAAAIRSASAPVWSGAPAKSWVTMPIRGVGIVGLRQQFGPAGHRRKPAREILDAGREQPDGVERPRITLHADRRQHPVGRLYRGRAAERRRPDHRAAGLRSQRQRNHAGAHRRGRSRRRSARRVAVVVRIERRGRIVRCERRGRGLADDGGARRLQRRDDRRIRARLPAAIDRRADFGRKIRRIDVVLDADRDAAQRTVIGRAGAGVMTDKGADGLVLRADRLERLRDGRLGRQFAGIDPALKFGERYHGRYSLWRRDRFYGSGRNGASARRCDLI